ncbi:CdaR family transcriptional regulator [Suipraeoptans intestinalis]|nr:sugar diacid recognition domain-containing protein [Suipraeoptans intestinalis]MDD7770020.1 sugar diacid recognition domain-containing protein [Suipraeoptans intestinalis]MDY3121750.1 sugar diacid recognition domain-containing protein [Suipraeoptans intestinalis]
MHLSDGLANQIVHAIHEVVKRDTNLIAPSGKIIASTDPERIGTVHAAGASAIHRGLPVFVDDAHPFQGSKPGINYPIFLDHAPIAAIGITGPPEELKSYGFLITKISEVFFKEQHLSEEFLSESRAIHYLVTSLIYNNIQDPSQLHLLLDKYRISSKKQYAVFALYMNDISLETSLRFYFRGLACPLFHYLYPNEWIAIFDEASFRNFIPGDFSARFHGQVVSGLGSFTPIHQLHHSYRSASLARTHAERICSDFYDSRCLSLEFVLEHLPPEARQILASQVLKSLTDKECHLLNCYFSNNLSLTKTAGQLHIHKNTLQYQLNCIAQKTSWNPRKFQDAVFLQLALCCLEA